MGLGRMNCDSSMFGPARLGEKKISKRNAVRTAPSVVSLIQRSRRTARLVTAEAKHGADSGCFVLSRRLNSGGGGAATTTASPASIRLGSVELARPRVSRS